MAIATNSGHAQRAIDFYKKPGKYFVIGGTTPWDDDANPPAPSPDDYKLIDIVGLKSVDSCKLVVPDNEYGTIPYGDDQSWRIVEESISTIVAPAGITENSTVIPLTDLKGITRGCKLRIGDTYEGKVLDYTTSPSITVTLDTASPSTFAGGTVVKGGATIEGAKYVYLACTLERDNFPYTTSEGLALSYRQIGILTGVTPATQDILLPGEFTSLGVLEIIDNRRAFYRDADMSEQLAYITEF